VLLVAAGCEEDTVEPPPPPPDDGPKVTVAPNQRLGTWPHRFDVYSVDDADKVIVLLHGGGGTKEHFAYELGLKRTADGSNYAVANGQVLLDNHTIAVFPQGQAIAAAPTIFTWNNYVMDSGEDDVQFMRDLVDHLIAQYNVSKICIAGHSNGGMMVNRIWCEAPELFTAFVSIAGPPSEHFLGIPCVPSLARRFLCIVGAQDGVLQNGAWEAQTWTINPALTQGPAFVDPDLVGDRYFFPTRVTHRCSATVAPGDADAVMNGNLTTWSFCSSSMQLIRIETAGHSVESLEAASGRSLLAMALDFCEP
jgi:predicted esterase